MIDDSLQRYMLDCREFAAKRDELQDRALFNAAFRGPEQKRRQAFLELAESKLRFVVFIVLRHFHEIGSLTLADLVQEGNLALIKCLEKALKEPDRAGVFNSYIPNDVKSHLYRVIANHSRVVRLSVAAIQQLAQIARAERQWLNEFGQEPTSSELSALTGLSADRIRLLTERSQPTVSLDSEEIRAAILGNAFTDPRPDPRESLDLEELRACLMKLLLTLDDIEREVLCGRFALGDHGLESISQLAARLHCNHETIQKIEDRALRRLKHPDRMAALREFGAN